MDRLGVRIALAIGGSIAIVVVLVGIVVSVSVSSRFTQYLRDDLRARGQDVAALVVDAYSARGSLRFGTLELRQLAVAAGGPIAIYDAAGNLVAEYGRAAGTPGVRGNPVVVPLESGGVVIGRLDLTPTALSATLRQAAGQAFRRAIAQTLLLAGLAALAVSMLVALFMGLRLTRPLAAMAAAAHRLGTGDLSVRVPVPSDREGQELAVAFNSMAQNLERSEALRRRAASDLAHEIATPVTVLTTQLDALADGVVRPSKAQLQAARSTAGEVASLIGDLHDLAAAEGAALHRSVERVDLAAIVRRAGTASSALFDQRGITFAVEAGPPGTAWALVDPRHLERVLTNLLTNAATYTPGGGSVRLALSREGSWLRVRVIDTGPGIPPAHQAHVFERFYRADPARGRVAGVPGGSGIGLTVARELARANRGDVRIEQTSPGGTTFVVDVPAGS